MRFCFENSTSESGIYRDVKANPSGNYMLKDNNRNTKTWY